MNEEEIFDKLKSGRYKPSTALIRERENSTEVVEYPEGQLVGDEDDDVETLEIKKSIKNVIRIGDESLETMQQVAEASEHPKAYETLAQLMRTVVDANKTLMDIKTKRKGKTNTDPEPPPTPTTIYNDNRTISLTPSQLRDKLKEE